MVATRSQTAGTTGGVDDAMAGFAHGGDLQTIAGGSDKRKTSSPSMLSPLKSALKKTHVEEKTCEQECHEGRAKGRAHQGLSSTKGHVNLSPETGAWSKRHARGHRSFPFALWHLRS